ncbi:basic secretory family protein [Nonomuraea sp. NBC_01738]|uniref:hypothetical protein n=1 Tax=Nonomuraea sp. NBC_01738 TaxID=2976003 RepID=UPI002E13057B|nr:basic secretory family protein [Nonomuraea sp. NBC_01738]
MKTPWKGALSRRAALGALALVMMLSASACRTEPESGAAAADPDLSRRAQEAALRVGGVLGVQVTPKVRMAASARDAARDIGAASVDGLAAVAHDGEVIVIPETYARLTPAGRDVVLTHELTHVAAGTDGLPPWLYEGFADYVAYRDAGLAVPVAAAELAKEVRAGKLPRTLPDAARFAPGSPRLAQSYQEAWLACRFLAGRFGEDRLVRIYREARSQGVARALPLSMAELTARWRAYLREELA